MSHMYSMNLFNISRSNRFQPTGIRQIRMQRNFSQSRPFFIETQPLSPKWPEYMCASWVRVSLDSCRLPIRSLKMMTIMWQRSNRIKLYHQENKNIPLSFQKILRLRRRILCLFCDAALLKTARKLKGALLAPSCRTTRSFDGFCRLYLCWFVCVLAQLFTVRFMAP